ncbi:MAG: leucyl aminopeptidase [Polyangiaceae bacterium]|nr:leucyl aminopeptidase [Polyangiaceae bacterium]
MLDLHFVAPDLRRLDEVGAEIIVACLWTDVRPLQGLSALLDWRLSGCLSKLLRQGFVVGEVGEVLIVPARPKLPFDKLLLFGLGPRTGFGDGTFRRVIERMLDALAGLSVKKAVVELPGRDNQLFEPERAAEILLDVARDDAHDAFVLVEEIDGQRRIETRVGEQRRNAPRR